MLTRRVRGRTFLLRPSKRTNQIVRYVVAVMVRKWNMKLHAIMVMSNHWHLCLTDPEGNIVNFQRDCHHFITRGLNTAYGDTEAMWNSSQSSRVEAEHVEDLIKQIAYTMANPVEAALVRHGRSWPGVRHAWPCRPRVIRRPRWYFRGEEDGGDWPETAVLELSRPPDYDELSDEELAGVIEAAIEEREEHFRRKYDGEKRRFLGRKAVLAQSRYARAQSKEERGRISPKVACGDKWRRVERLQANKLWRVEYDDARRQWVGGKRDVIFPAGTYQMRVQHAALCAPEPG